MKLPLYIEMAKGIGIVKGARFATGWANGVARYHRRKYDVIEACAFDVNDDAFAASEAAVAYCVAKERGR